MILTNKRRFGAEKVGKYVVYLLEGWWEKLKMLNVYLTYICHGIPIEKHESASTLIFFRSKQRATQKTMSREKETILVKPGRDSQNILRNRIRIFLLKNMTQVFLGEIQGIKKEKRKDFLQDYFLTQPRNRIIVVEWGVYLYFQCIFWCGRG